jgi:hypothetical protein
VEARPCTPTGLSRPRWRSSLATLRASWRVRGEVGREGGDVDGSATTGEVAREVEEEPEVWELHVSEMRGGLRKGNLVHTNIQPPPIHLQVGHRRRRAYIMAFFKQV